MHYHLGIKVVCVCVYHQSWKFARTAGITTGYRKEESLLGHQYSIGLSFYPDGECLIWAAESNLKRCDVEECVICKV